MQYKPPNENKTKGSTSFFPTATHRTAKNVARKKINYARSGERGARPLPPLASRRKPVCLTSLTSTFFVLPATSKMRRVSARFGPENPKGQNSLMLTLLEHLGVKGGLFMSKMHGKPS